MCKENKICLILLLSALLFLSVWGAAHPQGWFLITEAELQSIEAYKKRSEQEKRNWLSQAQGLKAESESLNRQLADQRERNRRLTLSFNEYEAVQSRIISQKNTQIIKLETENKGKGKTIARLITAVAVLGLTWLAYIIFKVCRFFKIIPL
jgi:hypothetical protein